jgi:class 3 adenylate cyclase
LEILERLNFLTKLNSDRKSIQIEKIKKDSEKLVLNIFPKEVGKILLKTPSANIADSYREVTIIFCDIPNFKEFERTNDPHKTVSVLNEIICKIDESCEKYGIEKIKTIGPTYMAMSGGLSSSVEGHHCIRMLDFAASIIREIEAYNEDKGYSFEVQIGINGIFYFTFTFTFTFTFITN